MQLKLQSPCINHLSWGKMKIEDSNTVYKDVKLFPGGSREWDWSETGTKHEPGVQSGDIEELLEHGAKVVILSSGYYERLQIMHETRKLLQEKNIPFHVLQTEDAVKLYNKLRKKQLVGGLFHSTC